MSRANQLPLSQLKNLRTQRKERSAPLPSPAVPTQLAPELEALAAWLDSAFRVPGLGIRFGLDAILGLIPGVGDTFSSLASLYILHAATRYGVPRTTIMRMGLNVAIDYVVGSLPIVGDLFDVFWKSNQWNVAILRHHLATAPDQRKQSTWGDRLFVAVVIAMLLATLVGSVLIAVWLMRSLAHVIGL
ncbi:MAG TPA: DUF4112 domain-containing protein [Pirellulales bacterium]|jgi:hypothetical protein